MARGARAHLPSSFVHYLPACRDTPRTLVVGVSQSGRSTATGRALARATDLGGRTLLVTGDAVASASRPVLDIRSGPELVGAKTKGFVCTVASLLLLGDALAGRQGAGAVARLPQVVHGAIAAAPAAIDALFGDAVPESVTLLSYGPNLATVREGGLKIFETARLPVEALDVEEYLHGPHRRLVAGSVLVMAAPHGPMLERALLLREFAAGLGARVLMISDTRCGLPAGAPELVVPVVDGDALGAIAFIAPLQLLAVELAACRGYSPEDPVFAGFHERLASKSATQ
jgi:glucosamine--fructose-6-phosphate aminotransferase (isomerizing)